MSDEPTFVADVIKAVAASSVLGAAAWGAAGGATSGLLIRVGRLALPLISGWMGLPEGTISPTAGGATGSGAYLAGLLLPALFEVVLTRLRRGVLPTDPDRGGG